MAVNKWRENAAIRVYYQWIHYFDITLINVKVTYIDSYCLDVLCHYRGERGEWLKASRSRRLLNNEETFFFEVIIVHARKDIVSFVGLARAHFVIRRATVTDIHKIWHFKSTNMSSEISNCYLQIVEYRKFEELKLELLNRSDTP